MGEVVWSINILLAILLIGVCVTIYWIFKYDDWNPNPVTDLHVPESDGSGHTELGSRAE